MNECDCTQIGSAAKPHISSPFGDRSLRVCLCCPAALYGFMRRARLRSAG
jgi:hypothetical protein